ncbi:neuropathy target esterase sws isoform X4 [Pieris brassicae]|uniref:neuropathy target esterase sws isoform X4 n=1 Tax=Pieris brassicae TaxID=7116 RepID=UPI001E65F6E8|nr:neuropathy target esterase sws isoform X4 [Pieris brassicae]XP_045526939.1 neuropathy target esterase sws isoform X4 [Pieris brassicae]
MDVVGLLNNINKKSDMFAVKTWTSEWSNSFQENQLLWSFCGCLLVSLLVVFIYYYRRWRAKELSEGTGATAAGEPAKRFRKRDKMLFYGRRMLRKVKSISNSGQGRKRRAVMRFARKLLQLKKESAPEQLKVLEPPAEYLEEDLTSDDRVPPDALYMLHSIRVFGHFEKPVFLMLCKHTEILNLPAGSFLFKVGDTDENVYVVQNGRVNVYISNQDGSSLSLKIVRAGESVTSLLSFTDVLTGNSQPYKTVNAKALEDSQVIKLPMRAFQEVFKEYPDIFVRVIQIIMVRLQRVTFTALHQYLGLSAELVNPGREKRRPNTTTASPMKTVKPVDCSTATHSPSHSERLVTEHTQEGSMATSSPIHIQGRRPRSDMPDVTSNIPQQSQPDVQPTSSFQRPKEGSSFKKHNTDNLDEQALIQIATEAFIKELGLENDQLLTGCVQVRDLPAGTYIMKEESHKDVALVYLLSGALLVSQRVAEGEGEVHMFTAYPGEVEGGLAVLTGEPSFFSIRAKHFSRIGLLSKTSVYSIMRERPSVVLHIANTVVKRLSPFVRQVDFALDWVFLESGRAVYRQDEESGSTFIVLSGRLRSVITHPNGKKELVGEYGKGDLVGIVEMVTQTRRSTTVMAVRDSELAKLPEGLFNAIKLRFPVVVTRLINLLGHRILGSWQKPTAGLGGAAAIESRPSQHNFSTVAVVPVSDDVPLTAFTYELYHSLCAIGPTVRLTSDVIRKLLGLTIMDPNNEYRLSSWLAQQEDKHKVALYQCDPSLTQWTQRCIRQADCILIVALGDKQPSIGKIEKEIERLAIRTQKELVLLHREGGANPTGTVHWLNMRTWVSQHHHVRCPHRMFTRKSQYRISELYSKVLMSEASVHSDFSRLARWLTGTSVGLVLGGGGARGAAHVGMVRAIQEAGIPIDMVGGVSIGAFMGALWCMERNITTVTQKAREWSQKMTQWGKQLLDLTYPATSMFSGRQFNTTIKATFGEVHIEDLWLPYFTVTTDISSSCMRVHRHGSLWRYIRASMSLSGYMPPLCDPVDGHLLLDGGYVNNLPGILWRYCRASMSIAGIFPPICDTMDGHLLLDGCYVNNVPADVMRSFGAKHILAIDVGSQDDTDLTNYGDDLSGWWLLWKRWNPFTSPVKVPNLPDIQSRLAYVSCNRQLEEVKKSDYCEYIRPPIDQYKTLQFGSFDEIREVGYRHGTAYFEGQRRGGGGGVSGAAAERRKHLAQPSLTDYTFTDLAQMVCSVRTARDGDNDSSSSSDYEEDQRHFEGYASEPSGGILEMSSSVEGAAWISDTELVGTY